MNTIQIAPPTAALVIDQPTEYVDRTLATASWWDQYLLLPGIYPFAWVNINHSPWNADPQARTSGYLANTGPYYGSVTVDALLTEEYRESRLLSHVTADHKRHEEPEVVKVHRTVYAYELPGCPKGTRGRVLEKFMGGRVVAL